MVLPGRYVPDTHWATLFASYTTRFPSVCIVTRNRWSGEYVGAPPPFTVAGTELPLVAAAAELPRAKVVSCSVEPLKTSASPGKMPLSLYCQKV